MTSPPRGHHHQGTPPPFSWTSDPSQQASERTHTHTHKHRALLQPDTYLCMSLDLQVKVDGRLVTSRNSLLQICLRSSKKVPGSSSPGTRVCVGRLSLMDPASFLRSKLYRFAVNNWPERHCPLMLMDRSGSGPPSRAASAQTRRTSPSLWGPCPSHQSLSVAKARTFPAPDVCRDQSSLDEALLNRKLQPLMVPDAPHTHTQGAITGAETDSPL